MAKPLEFLAHIQKFSDTLSIWTQYFDDAVLTDRHPGFYHLDRARNVIQTFHGMEIPSHWRSYVHKDGTGISSGGEEDYAYWLTLPDIRRILSYFGFRRITMDIDNPQFGLGPACFFLAHR